MAQLVLSGGRLYDTVSGLMHRAFRGDRDPRVAAIAYPVTVTVLLNPLTGGQWLIIVPTGNGNGGNLAHPDSRRRVENLGLVGGLLVSNLFEAQHTAIALGADPVDVRDMVNSWQVAVQGVTLDVLEQVFGV